MVLTLAVILVLVAVAVAAFVWWDGRESRRALEAQSSAMQQSMQALDARLTAGVEGVRTSLTSSITTTHETMRSVDQQLGRLSESTRRMLEVGREISELQQMLRAPKPRGQFGELLLERLLADMLPQGNFALQHRFANGHIVDAVISFGGGLVPVDAKFPDAAFGRIIAADDDDARTAARKEFVRDVRAHIDAVSKYILPDEGTFGFALMYVPAENVYYEAMMCEGDLLSYAHGRRVMVCGPNSLFGYLQAIVLGLRGLRVEERSREIVAHLERLAGDFGRFRNDFETLGRHISNAHAKYDDLDRATVRLGERIARPLEGDGSRELEEGRAGDKQSALSAGRSVE